MDGPVDTMDGPVDTVAAFVELPAAIFGELLHFRVHLQGERRLHVAFSVNCLQNPSGMPGVTSSSTTAGGLSAPDLDPYAMCAPKRYEGINSSTSTKMASLCAETL